jgi:pyruvate dehydrogenase E1 component alpha subunit
VLVCQNNQFAISTPVTTQTCSETLAVKGLVYAVPSLRVDGNDVLAMVAAIKDAVDTARRGGGGPTFIEAVTYRLGAHSSADDPTHYRDGDVLAAWQKRDPLLRFGQWLTAEGVLAADAQAAARQRLTDEIRAAIAAEEAVGPPPAASLFDHVFHQPTWLLDEQKACCRQG